MTIKNLDHANLNAVEVGGVVREEVMDKIWQLDNWKLPFTEMCSKGTHSNQRVEFTTDEFAPSVDDNAVVDGADIDQDDSSLGNRVANYTQTSVKAVQVSTRANAANTIGRQGTLGYQIAQRQKELRKDVESQMLSTQGSEPGDALAVAGNSAGFGAWVATNTVGGAGFTPGGFNTASGMIDAPVLGAPQAISETMIKDIMEAIYKEGGEAKFLMTTPQMIRKISDYYFTDQAKTATMINDNASGTAKLTAYGATNVIVQDFGVLTLVPNRQMLSLAPGVSAAYIIDPSKLKQSFMTGYRVDSLAKTGLSEKRLMSVDYSLLVFNEKSQGAMFDLDETAAMVA